jgi:hypothetical protein
MFTTLPRLLSYYHLSVQPACFALVMQRASRLAHIENQSCRNARLLNFLEGMIDVLKLTRLIHHVRLACRV